MAKQTAISERQLMREKMSRSQSKKRMLQEAAMSERQCLNEKMSRCYKRQQCQSKQRCETSHASLSELNLRPPVVGIGYKSVGVLLSCLISSLVSWILFNDALRWYTLIWKSPLTRSSTRSSTTFWRCIYTCRVVECKFSRIIVVLIAVVVECFRVAFDLVENSISTTTTDSTPPAQQAEQPGSHPQDALL
jgi:hypothetical protein